MSNLTPAQLVLVQQVLDSEFVAAEALVQLLDPNDAVKINGYIASAQKIVDLLIAAGGAVPAKQPQREG